MTPTLSQDHRPAGQRQVEGIAVRMRGSSRSGDVQSRAGRLIQRHEGRNGETVECRVTPCMAWKVSEELSA